MFCQYIYMWMYVIPRLICNVGAATKARYARPGRPASCRRSSAAQTSPVRRSQRSKYGLPSGTTGPDCLGLWAVFCAQGSSASRSTRSSHSAISATTDGRRDRCAAAAADSCGARANSSFSQAEKVVESHRRLAASGGGDGGGGGGRGGGRDGNGGG